MNWALRWDVSAVRRERIEEREARTTVKTRTKAERSLTRDFGAWAMCSIHCYFERVGCVAALDDEDDLGWNRTNSTEWIRGRGQI